MMIQNRIFTDMPILSPSRSFINPMSHGPIIPPSPPHAKNMPSMVPELFAGIPETTAVAVGKMIEKQNPVNASTIAMEGGPNIPSEIQRTASKEKISRLFRWPALSTKKLPSSRPMVMPAK